jgi:hypothetical protein
MKLGSYTQRPFLDADNRSSDQIFTTPFMGPDGSLPCSQQLATGPYPEPVESSSRISSYVFDVIPELHAILQFLRMVVWKTLGLEWVALLICIQKNQGSNLDFFIPSAGVIS